MQKINDVRDRLIVALDVPTVWDAYRLVSTLGDGVTFYKIGYRLAFAGGLDLARQLVAEGKKVFLDLKLHDIGNTVTEGVDSLTKLGVTFLTVHAYPQTMRGAVEGRGDAALKLLAVTALTSYDDGDLKDAGYGLAVRDLCACAPSRPASPGSTASSAPPPRPRSCAASSVRTWSSSPPASARPAPSLATGILTEVVSPPPMTLLWAMTRASSGLR